MDPNVALLLLLNALDGSNDVDLLLALPISAFKGKAEEAWVRYVNFVLCLAF